MTARLLGSPLWKEGMFLAPQHMQQADNYRDGVDKMLMNAAPPFPWGLEQIEIDTNLLSSYQFTVHSLRAVAPSKDILYFPGNIEVPSRSFEGVMTDPQQRVKVYLGIPDYERDGPNLLDDKRDGEGARFRFRAHDIDLTDENTGISERTIQVKRIRGRLLFEGEDAQGFQLLPLARIKPAPNMEGAVLDDEYVPPLMNVGAWPSLRKNVEGVAAKLRAVQSNLRRSVGSKGIAEWCAGPRGIELIMKMQAVNQASHALHQVAHTSELCPYNVYLEILRCIGAFQIFQGPEKLDKVPYYDHLQLGGCFQTAIELLRKQCTSLDAQDYVRRPFVDRQSHWEVDLDAEWLSGARKLYVCVSGAGDYNEVIKKLAAVRVCAPSHFAQVLQRRIQALHLQWLRRPPSSLPATEGAVYAEVMQAGRFWPGVMTERALAVGSSERLAYRLELFVE